MAKVSVTQQSKQSFAFALASHDAVSNMDLKERVKNALDEKFRNRENI